MTDQFERLGRSPKLSARLACMLLLVGLVLPYQSSAQLPRYFLPQADSGKTVGGQATSAMTPPDTAFISNSVIDIIEHGGGVWLATDDGVSFSFDGGITWLLYDTSNGLVSQNLSAIYSTGGRLWLGTNHRRLLDEELFTLSDGVSFSDDNGDTWTQVDYGPDGLDIPSLSGINRIVFDISGHYDPVSGEDWLFFTAWAGGFVGSLDGGTSWRRLYASRADSINYVDNVAPSLRNLYFACVADTSRGDSMFVWTGTAEGMFLYIWAEPREKLAQKVISRLSFCESCSGDGVRLFMAGDDGITRSSATGAPFASRFESNGLPGPFVSAILNWRGRLFAGTLDREGGTLAGIAYSDDNGDSFVPVSGFNAQYAGLEGTAVTEFEPMMDRLYMAAGVAGLFVSLDSGLSWSHLFVDSADTVPDNGRNVVRALSAAGDTLYVGTDSGLVSLVLDSAGTADTAQTRLDRFVEGPISAARVVRVRLQDFYTTDTISGQPVLDSQAIWTINHPATDSGTFHIARRTLDTTLWKFWFQDSIINDVNFLGDTAIIAGQRGMLFTVTALGPTSFNQYFRVKNASDNFNFDTVLTMEVLADTVAFGSRNGVAISVDRGETYSIYRPNLDTLGADLTVHFSSTGAGVTSNFIQAMGVQYTADGPARIWASNHPQGGGAGLSRGVVDSVAILDSLVVDTLDYLDLFNWRSVYSDGFAWNFAFNGETTFVAADTVGLLMNTGFGQADNIISWDTIPFVDGSDTLVAPGVGVIGVQVIGSNLWVGTDLRTVVFDLTTMRPNSSFFFVDSTTSPDEVYAYPVPFSMARHRAIDFHFTLGKAADVTLEVYDFAMNLVRRVMDNKRFAAGVYHGRNMGVPTWDGINGEGDEVAVGVYYFRLSTSTGEEHWGKLAVMP